MQMKKSQHQSLGLLLALLFLTSCLDSPRDRRASFPDRSANQNSSMSAYPNNSATGGSVILPGGGGGSQNNANNESENTEFGQPTGSAPQVPVEIDHCQWSRDGQTGFAQQHAHLGHFTLCQSRNTDVDVHLQLKNPPTDSQICIFPTYHTGTSSVYIGEARCFIASNPKTIYKITLLKNRPNYGQFNVTGVMVMKDKAFFYPAPFYQYVLSPDAYLFCSQFLDQHQDPSYCQAFRSVGQYIYHQF